MRWSPCLPWKPFTAVTVATSYTPVVVSGSHAIWESRCWSSRTFRPFAPGFSTAVTTGVRWVGELLGELLGEGGGVAGGEELGPDGSCVDDATGCES